MPLETHFIVRSLEDSLGSHGMAAELRRRAGELRRLAEHMAATPLREIARRGGPDTWISPQADELRATLDVDRRRLDAAADDLRSHARYLERRAEAIELAAVLSAGA